MMRQNVRALTLACMVALAAAATASQAQQTQQQVAAALAPHEGDYVAHDFHFKSGETLAELRLHYTTLGTPAPDAQGRTTNAVLILHGTGGSGGGSSLLFRWRAVRSGADAGCARYYIILPDGIGHGKSSKPSDGMRAHFPKYDYDDMVAAQHALSTKGLE